MYDAEDTPVLMDFGSMGPAMIEVKNLSDALKIQVNYMNYTVWHLI